jgi:ribosome-binding ATPase YchF (GTP1/OBG family)
MKPSRCAASTSARTKVPLLKQFFLITAKPAMFVANVAEDGFGNNPFLDRLTATAQNAPVELICAR